MKMKKVKRFLIILCTCVFGIVYSLPILYMFISSFKKEEAVVPFSLFFSPTLENYQSVLSGGFLFHLWNSSVVTVATVLAALLFGVIAAYILVFGGLSKKKANSLYFWFISTIILPPVVVLIPAFIIFDFIGLLDTKLGLVILFTGVSAPLVVWMVRSFMQDVPFEIIEAAKIDGCSEVKIFWSIVLPLVKTGVLSAGLLVFILTWNEVLFALTLTFTKSPTLPIFMAAHMSQQGYFWAGMSAVASVIILPPVIMGIFMQKAFVRALTGGIKG